jgi:hypothetical protein
VKKSAFGNALSRKNLNGKISFKLKREIISFVIQKKKYKRENFPFFFSVEMNVHFIGSCALKLKLKRTFVRYEMACTFFFLWLLLN